MAQAMGVSKARVQRLWSANEIKSHLVRTFKLSNDPAFEAKFWELIGLYLDPPDKALVLCCDEKSQCQALELTQPGLPLGVGHIRTKPHDYTPRHRHHRAVCRALLSRTANIFGQTAPRHMPPVVGLPQASRCQNPPDLTLHLVIDDYATHKHPKVRSWIAYRNRRPAQGPWPRAHRPSFRPDLELVDELGRAFLPRPHRGRCARRQLCQCRRACVRH
jgi:hypothetical protein